MLTLLSFGAGQDSTAILYRILLDPEFKQHYVNGKFLVVMSDTGDEHDDTYSHIHFVQQLCQKHQIEFYFLRPTDGYHPNGCHGLIPWLKKNACIMSKAYKKTCTDNLKIKPLYNFLDHYIGKNLFNRDIPCPESKKGFIKLYARQHGKINILLGSSADEQRRMGKNLPAPWMIRCLRRVYPLVDLGWTRQHCQQYIKSTGWPLPPPSNCKRCRWLNEIELVWLYRFHPEDYHEWVQMECAKVDRCRKAGLPDDKNLGVHGTLMLPQALQAALAKHGHLTDDELNDYKMSHGHCVGSQY